MEENNIPMTKEECIRQLDECTKQYNQRVRDDQARHREDIKAILQRWADSNARFAVGDVIGTPDRKYIIRVEKILGARDASQKQSPVHVSYMGQRLNEDLSPHWVKSPAFLADIEENLVKIERP